MNFFSIGNTVLEFDELASTNDYALELIRENSQLPENGLVIWAKNQTNGRGQRSNVWLTQANKNLTFSIILTELNLELNNSFLLSMAIANGISDFLSAKDVAQNNIKWPNDILIERKKIAGILIENTIKGDKISTSVIGIGLNINQENFENLTNVTSLFIEKRNVFDVKECLNELLKHIEKQLVLLALKKHDSIKQNYILRLFGYKQELIFSDAISKFTAVIIDVKNDGALVIEKNNNEKKAYYFKEIKLEID